MDWVEAVGYVGAALTLATYSVRRMIPLRIVGIGANCVFIVYGILTPVYPQLLMSTLLLVINAYRLWEMLRLVSKVKVASQGDLNMEWVRPYMTRRTAKAGEVLFRKDDQSSAMFYTLSGRYRLTEIGQDVEPGEMIGEIGLIAPGNRRMFTFECIEDGELLTIDYDHVKQLYFQNPPFGFYFLQLVSKRLFKDIERLEQRVARPA
jgi:hypothetical protein